MKKKMYKRSTILFKFSFKENKKTSKRMDEKRKRLKAQKVKLMRGEQCDNLLKDIKKSFKKCYHLTGGAKTFIIPHPWN